jgi:hypothetical protein
VWLIAALIMEMVNWYGEVVGWIQFDGIHIADGRRLAQLLFWSALAVGPATRLIAYKEPRFQFTNGPRTCRHIASEAGEQER